MGVKRTKAGRLTRVNRPRPYRKKKEEQIMEVRIVGRGASAFWETLDYSYRSSFCLGRANARRKALLFWSKRGKKVKFVK